MSDPVQDEANIEFQETLKRQIQALESENQRLRETIQRNEDKSVECERLRDGLNKIYKQSPGCGGCKEIARSALNGGKP